MASFLKRHWDLSLVVLLYALSWGLPLCNDSKKYVTAFTFFIDIGEFGPYLIIVLPMVAIINVGFLLGVCFCGRKGSAGVAWSLVSAIFAVGSPAMWSNGGEVYWLLGPGYYLWVLAIVFLVVVNLRSQLRGVASERITPLA
jgi:hypothetical protein